MTDFLKPSFVIAFLMLLGAWQPRGVDLLVPGLQQLSPHHHQGAGRVGLEWRH